MIREFPAAPLFGVGAVVVDAGRVLLIQRGREPLKGNWSLPGGLLEVGESLHAGLIREVQEETGLLVEPIELIELLDRIYRDGERVRYHYVIGDYLCRLKGGAPRDGVPGDGVPGDRVLQAASDADAARWVERAEWNGDPSQRTLAIDSATVRVMEAGWQRARALQSEGSF
jgi:ADP-ribose pyrophosphatase YjhB (NUDIX family)